MVLRVLIVLFILFLSISCQKEPQVAELFFKLTTETKPENSGTLSLEMGNYKSGSVRTLHAAPNEGWIFSHWEGIVSGLSNPTDIIFLGDHDIRAVFIKDTFKVRTIAGGNGKGFELNQLNYPTGITHDQHRNIYVSDMYNHRVQKWVNGATFGKTIAGGNGYGNGNNQLNKPGKIAIDPLGAVYIADTENHRIQKWYNGEKKGVTIAGGNGSGKAKNQLNTPYGIALDNDGAIYISEIENHRVTRWYQGDTEGQVVAGGNGNGDSPNQLSFPMGIAIDQNKNLYVADTYNHRVQLWKPGADEGINILNAEDLEFADLNYFTGICFDKNKKLYLSDYYNRRIIEFDLIKESLKVVAGGNNDGSKPNQFSHPFQIVSKTDDYILVADAKNNRIQKWKLDEN